MICSSIPLFCHVETSGTIIEEQGGYTEEVLSITCDRKLGGDFSFGS